ncbi:hypothetical protein A3864_12070 (plasmid) [Priestia endophytica]|uniref:Uncharacterized protein n=1 Tax=Priestia endophytica TaxID=135735 RepID=A0AAX1Q8Q9_9BACI|nr:hypothetical protein A3864_12070 [Priestia endophytica]
MGEAFILLRYKELGGGFLRHILLNGSINIGDNTARLANEFFWGLEYTPINLAEFHINQIEQEFEQQRDEFQKVMKQSIMVDEVVIGTSDCWSSMTIYYTILLNLCINIQVILI